MSEDNEDDGGHLQNDASDICRLTHPRSEVRNFSKKTGLLYETDLQKIVHSIRPERSLGS